jgi:hypothetical protein
MSAQTDVNGNATKHDECPECGGRLTVAYPRGSHPLVADHCVECGWRSGLHDGSVP